MGPRVFFLRSRLTDLPLICTTAPRSLVSGTRKPPTSRLREMYRPWLHCCQRAVCCVGGWRANRASQIKAGVAERSECGSLEAGGDNGGEETQVTPSEWRAVAWIAPPSLKSTPASQKMPNTHNFTVLNSAPDVTSRTHKHRHTQINLF